MDALRQQRIQALKDMLIQNEKDVFALYGLALEYKALGELDAALPLLRKVVVLDPEQLYAYYQLGEILNAQGEEDDAIPILEEGLAHARRLGNVKAINELQALLDMI